MTNEDKKIFYALLMMVMLRRGPVRTTRVVHMVNNQTAKDYQQEQRDKRMFAYNNKKTGGKKVTFDEASQIYYINIEIKAIRLELAKLKEERRYYKPNIISDMPRGGSGYDPRDEYLAREQELEDMLNYALRKLQYERRRIEEFLNTVDDAETRLIIRLRCVNNMKWEEIGEEINTDRRTASRKFYKFFGKK